LSNPVIIRSFGYLHGELHGDYDLTVDVRRHLRDPHVDPAFRELDGQDVRVIQRVLDTPGALGLINGLLTAIDALYPIALERGVALRVAIGCAGGRHRSVVLADHLAYRLTSTQRLAVVGHRDLGKPVVLR
jgi:UPF0042 nucleotide-binding protein